MIIVIRALLWTVWRVALLVSVNAAAQSTSENESYSNDFFAEYTPQTALDMVLRLPGFSLVETDDEIRGFVAGGGNVLIDDRRPTTKSGGIEEALSRIPASQVEKIEIIRGVAGLSDAAGQAVVANVVRRDTGTAHSWKFSLENTSDGKLSPSTELVTSKEIIGWDSAFKLNAIQDKQPREAKILSYSGGQSLVERLREDRPSTLNEIFLSGDSKRDFGEQRQLVVNGRVGWSQYLTDTQRTGSSTQASDDSIISFFNNERNSRYYTGEFGLEWQQPLTRELQWRVLSINNAQNWFVDSDSNREMPIDSFAGESSLRFEERKSEHVLRTLVSFHPEKKQLLSRYEIGIEAAYSDLDSWLTRRERDTPEQSMSITRDTYSRAVESRGELFANFTLQLSKLTVDTGLAGEYSQLRVDGDNRGEQSLFFLKPAVTFVYDTSQQTQYRLELRRSVGQLDFSDFAASSDLVNDREFSGNPRLRPDSSYRAAVSLDHRFSEKGVFSIELYHDWRQDVLEQIVLPSGDSALGNAGDAKARGLNASLNLPLDTWIPDSQLSLDADYIDTDFQDPVTGEDRQLTQTSNLSFTANFRQDLRRHGISWGLGYQGPIETEEFLVNEYNLYRTQSYWTAFLETFLFSSFKVRLSANQIGGEEEDWDRWLYQGDRSGVVDLKELTERRRDPSITLSISRSY
mgnify:CR=1 FL=1